MPDDAELRAHRHVSVENAWQRAYAAARAPADWPASVAPAIDVGRPAVDARAAWLRWHDATVGDDCPPGQSRWFALLERARVEMLASADLCGMKRNLASLESLLPSAAAEQAVYRLAREVFGDNEPQWVELPPPPAKPVHRSVLGRWWPRRIEGRAAPRPDPPSAGDMVVVLETARAALADAQRFRAVVEPLVVVLAACYALERPAKHDARSPEQPGGEPSPDEEGDPVTREGAMSPLRLTAGERASDAAYAVYSTRWDEVIDAAALADDAVEVALTDAQRQQVVHLAQRLQRRLLAARQPHWRFDQEEGRLDNRRLTRLLTPGGSTAVFRQEHVEPLPDACVTLLVDQSGSMRGDRQRIVALAVAFAAQTLERCRISCEVLGYTTRFGTDSNPVVEAWRAAGSPARPGRLNALRHVVYKPAARSWRQSRRALRLLQGGDAGRENIDGESLAWAAHRLALRPEPRKILLVLCDGAPCDEATTRAMGRGFLEDHLRAVIHRIESGPVHLAALGASADAGRFYRHCVVLPDVDSVADRLFTQLGDLLTGPATGRGERH